MGQVDFYARLADEMLTRLGSAAFPIWLGATVLLVAVLVAAVGALYFGRERSWSFAFLPLCLLLVAWARWPGIGLSALSNPDESFWIASAAALVQDPRPWYTVDTTTGGPLVPIPVMLAGILAGSFGWGTARVAAIAIWLLTLPLLYAALRIRFGQPVAHLALLPIVACVAFFSDEWNFLSFNSEHVANFLLALALYVDAMWLSKPGVERSRWPLVALGLTLGATPWAKLQVAPIAAFYGLYCLVRLLRKKQHAAAVTLAGAAVVPSVVVVAIVAAVGVLGDFWISYFSHNLHYARAGLSGMFGAEQVSLLSAVRRYPIDLLNNPDVLPLVASSLALVVISAVVSIRRRIRPSADVGVALILVLTAAWTTLQTREVFGHYLLLLFVPLTFLNGALLHAWIERSGSSSASPGTARFALTFIMFAFLVPSALQLTRANRAFDPAERRLTPASALGVTGAVVDSLTEPGDRVAIWGWAAPLWIVSGTLPGTRDVHTARQLMPSIMQPYFVNRFANDLEERKPRWFVDVAGWVRHFSDSTRYGHQSFPAVAGVVERDYELVAELDRAKIYRRREQSLAVFTVRSRSAQ